MSIFRREPESTPPTRPRSDPGPSPRGAAEPRREVTRIAPGSKFRGEIRGTTDLVIDGEVEGDLVLDNGLVVGERGLVTGRITARSVRVAGRVVGNIRGTERVEILPSGSLEGDVAAPRVIIGDGAFIKGKVEMTGHEGEQGPGGRPEPRVPGGTG